MTAQEGGRTARKHLRAGGLRFAVVASRFNELYCDRLLSGAQDCLAEHGAAASDVTVVRVPGSWEVPVVARRLASSSAFDAVIALGVLIRGETAHFDLIAAEVARGLACAAEQTGVPVAFGIVAALNKEQAEARAGGILGNRGWDAAMAAIETALTMKTLGRP
ncbi:MAG TPA: 6,7-dimethyl-8-ribityllumazine synthase [Candidatus Polarisedimenticolia bacterium]|nr:6,7-dimethyl-8-ribityllumazine synthase [Candidatus Polarisedimenticolia bacterium]